MVDVKTELLKAKATYDLALNAVKEAFVDTPFPAVLDSADTRLKTLPANKINEEVERMTEAETKAANVNTDAISRRGTTSDQKQSLLAFQQARSNYISAARSASNPTPPAEATQFTFVPKLTLKEKIATWQGKAPPATQAAEPTTSGEKKGAENIVPPLPIGPEADITESLETAEGDTDEEALEEGAIAGMPPETPKKEESAEEKSLYDQLKEKKGQDIMYGNDRISMRSNGEISSTSPDALAKFAAQNKWDSFEITHGDAQGTMALQEAMHAEGIADVKVSSFQVAKIKASLIGNKAERARFDGLLAMSEAKSEAHKSMPLLGDKSLNERTREILDQKRDDGKITEAQHASAIQSLDKLEATQKQKAGAPAQTEELLGGAEAPPAAPAITSTDTTTPAPDTGAGVGAPPVAPAITSTDTTTPAPDTGAPVADAAAGEAAPSAAVPPVAAPAVGEAARNAPVPPVAAPAVVQAAPNAPAPPVTEAAVGEAARNAPVPSVAQAAVAQAAPNTSVPPVAQAAVAQAAPVTSAPVAAAITPLPTTNTVSTTTELSKLVKQLEKGEITPAAFDAKVQASPQLSEVAGTILKEDISKAKEAAAKPSNDTLNANTAQADTTNAARSSTQLAPDTGVPTPTAMAAAPAPQNSTANATATSQTPRPQYPAPQAPSATNQSAAPANIPQNNADVPSTMTQPQLPGQATQPPGSADQNQLQAGTTAATFADNKAAVDRNAVASSTATASTPTPILAATAIKAPSGIAPLPSWAQSSKQAITEILNGSGTPAEKVQAIGTALADVMQSNKPPGQQQYMKEVKDLLSNSAVQFEQTAAVAIMKTGTNNAQNSTSQQNTAAPSAGQRSASATITPLMLNLTPNELKNVAQKMQDHANTGKPKNIREAKHGIEAMATKESMGKWEKGHTKKENPKSKDKGKENTPEKPGKQQAEKMVQEAKKVVTDTAKAINAVKPQQPKADAPKPPTPGQRK